MQEAHCRDFTDIVWQIAEKRGCDEVIIRYDCGHAIRADVWAPALPKTREYGTLEAERRRFVQHSLFLLTREPGASWVQITVPEGRCRHCGRGQRQVLICGPIQVDLTEGASTARRLELPLSSHAFLASMGQVCRLPENITPPPLLQGARGSVKPFDGPPLSREGLRQWSRKEVEDDLRGEVMKYIGAAMLVLIALAIECLYLCVLYLNPTATSPSGEGAGASSTRRLQAVLVKLVHACLQGSGQQLGNNLREVFIRPAMLLSQVPVTNPMAVAMVLSLLVAALSAPQPPSLSLPSVWSDLPNLEITRGLKKAVSRSTSLGPLVQRFRSLWGRKEGRPKGGLRGIPTARSSKERGHTNGRERAEVAGRPDKVQTGKQDGRPPAAASPQQSAPPCFVCLDRPSRYVLEPCGHRVVCGECAVQLVEAAARNRSMSEAAGGTHHGSERGGGACPSCGMAITRAMRLFS